MSKDRKEQYSDLFGSKATPREAQTIRQKFGASMTPRETRDMVKKIESRGSRKGKR
jgi:hypothetical protein